MAGASGAETSAAQLQAAARGGSGLTKGEPYLKSYGYMAGTVATFRSRGPQPPAAEARKTNRSRDRCVPRRLRPLAHRIFDRRIKKHFRRFTLYRSTDRGCKPGNVRFSVPTGVGNGESHSRRVFCLLFCSPKKEGAPRHEAYSKASVPRHERAKKNKCPSAKNSTFDPATHFRTTARLAKGRQTTDCKSIERFVVQARAGGIRSEI
ncbi:Uncharacterised protein [Rikenella microfusus]|uniref:Uncharacterized protein n=1 Tax=Rikenella microfusus TaxID=28139 RepID=A0A379MQL6_9BACT|nr:Uncharacterised protein [Rikenella microfusus]